MRFHFRKLRKPRFLPMSVSLVAVLSLTVAAILAWAPDSPMETGLLPSARREAQVLSHYVLLHQARYTLVPDDFSATVETTER